MTSEKYRITQKRFTDKVYNVSITDADGVPINITGSTLYVTVKNRFDEDADDSTAVIAKEITSHINPSQGQSQFTISRTESSIDAKDYILDIKVYLSGNLISSTVSGILTITNTAQNSLY
jgi:hypothetical protein